MTVEEYIKQHNDINYCEAIIFPDGTIEDARPSHIEALLRVTNESRDIINQKMPMEAGPLNWLVDYTNCVSLWFYECLLPEHLTENQLNTISNLIDAKILKNNYIGYMNKEISIIKRNQHYRETGEFYEVDKQILKL